MLTDRPTRRLPGIRFESLLQRPDETLPRMDVAVFIGFAASGPIDTPVPVQSVAEYAMIFGNDVPLAWDSRRGRPVYAYLASTVRAFFRNGGQRCWIVRVAVGAQNNSFAVPGLAHINNDGLIRPAFAKARSEGSWSDSLCVGTALLSQSMTLHSFSLSPPVLTLRAIHPSDLVAGDLLRLTFRDDQAKELYTVMFPVQTVAVSEPDNGSPVGQGSGGVAAVQITGGQEAWFRPVWRMQPPSTAGLMRIFSHDSISLQTSVAVPLAAGPLDGAGSPPSPKPQWPTAEGDQTITLNVHASLIDLPQAGSLIRVDFESEELWLVVQAVNISSEGGLSSSSHAQIVGQGAWRMHGPPWPIPATVPSVEKLSFELWVRQGETQSDRLGNLAFAKTHPRFWGLLPTDQDLYQEGMENRKAPVPALWHEASEPRYPLAGGRDTTEGFFFPFGMDIVPTSFLRPDKVQATPLERGGLAVFDVNLFLDKELRVPTLEDFNLEADFWRFQSDPPRRLTGIHSVLSIPALSSDEPTLIAVPDAVHSGWTKNAPSPSPAPNPSAPIFRPEWWHFSGCHPSPDTIQPDRPSETPPWEHFLNCDIRLIDRPLFQEPSEPDQNGTFTLAWSSIAQATYILEEAVSPDFSDAAGVFMGQEEHVTLYGRRPGVYYYRIRAVVGPNTSEWSVLEHPVLVGMADRWEVKSETDQSETLLAVQRALLRMCAARGDLFAVLSLPKHYREDQAVAHVSALKSPVTSADEVASLGYREAGVLSYGAVYHPWLSVRDTAPAGEIRDTPPDGSICGVFAHRALTRGAWIAPANEVLRGILALTPSIAPQRWLRWQEAQINLIRQDPRGFLALSSDTLSDDDDVRPINVRRLLMLLRRLALKLGATYVFEPHDDGFRRLVRRGFETLLDQMFVRGAFAGKTPDASYQVVMSDSLNTPDSVEQGRFIAEIRVAPSQPMAFLTIRLVQTGERGMVSEVK